MADRDVRMPAIPSIMKTVDPNVRNVLEPIRAILTDFTKTADPVVRFSTLKSAGLVKDYNLGEIIPHDTFDFSIPPTPTGLAAGGAFANIILTWDETAYGNLSYTEIWRAQTDDFSLAQLVGTSTARVYTDQVGDSATRYYWIRYVSKANVAGPFNAQSGVQASTSNDASYLLSILAGQITASELSNNLNQQIGGNTTAVKHIGAYYGIKAEVSADGRTVVGGMGIMGTADGEDGPEIDIGFVADRIWFAAPAGSANVPSIQPFVVQTSDHVVNGVTIPRGVYMDAAYITNLSAITARLGNAWIDNAMIANLSASKITAGDLSAARMSANIVTALTGKFNSLSALTANLGNVSLDSAGYLITTGVTSYGSGIGVWLGFSGGAYKFRVGDPSGQCLKWDGTTLTINGGGVFSGNLSAAGGTFAGALSAATGTFSGLLTASAINAVNTINIAGEAVTIPRSLQVASNSIPVSSTETVGNFAVQTLIADMPVVLASNVNNVPCYVHATVGWNGNSNDGTFTSITLTMLDPSGVEYRLSGREMTGQVCLSNMILTATPNVYPGTWRFRIYASCSGGITAATPNLFALTCAR